MVRDRKRGPADRRRGSRETRPRARLRECQQSRSECSRCLQLRVHDHAVPFTLFDSLARALLFKNSRILIKLF